MGNLAMVSALALIGLRPPFGSLHQYGISPHFRKSSDPVVVLPDDLQLLARRGVVQWRHVRQPPVRDVEAVNDGQAKLARGLNDTSTHSLKRSSTLSGPVPDGALRQPELPAA
jgi:hypothetical protein